MKTDTPVSSGRGWDDVYSAAIFPTESQGQREAAESRDPSLRKKAKGKEGRVFEQ